MDFLDEIRNDENILHFIKSPKAACFRCADYVSEYLHRVHIPHRAIGVFIWRGVDDSCPTTHLVIEAYYQGQRIILDPTIIQFKNTEWFSKPIEPFFGERQEWQHYLKNTFLNKLIILKEYPSSNLAKNFMDNFLFALPSDFKKDVLINKPMWYERLTQNPALWEKHDQNTINSFFPRAREKKHFPQSLQKKLKHWQAILKKTTNNH
ncbi:hypothetical protein ID850_13745 [Xenorhabdus sp. Flor]|uniref:hypothetical protein n=1 Tax=Xenorhabdus cabanillasii TaxID=351673 RepID=UPI0019BE14B5|nr:hypothetical protein [Xenorhabdus sp. Flor]MBD2815800.1 hypothetical protein [Xenorhabdus sp. Flor]